MVGSRASFLNLMSPITQMAMLGNPLAQAAVRQQALMQMKPMADPTQLRLMDAISGGALSRQAMQSMAYETVLAQMVSGGASPITAQAPSDKQTQDASASTDKDTGVKKDNGATAEPHQNQNDCWAYAAKTAAANGGEAVSKVPDKVEKDADPEKRKTGGTEEDEADLIQKEGLTPKTVQSPSLAAVETALKDSKTTGIVINMPDHAIALKPGDGAEAVLRDSGDGTKKKGNVQDLLANKQIQSMVISMKA